MPSEPMPSEPMTSESMTRESKKGILPAHAIEHLIKTQKILMDHPCAKGQIQPASLDLRLGEVAYRVRASFLPGPDVLVQSRINDLKMHEIDLSKGGAVLERDCVYIVPLQERLALDNSLCALTNPKSSTGRLDVFTRVICDGSRAFDQIGAGYKGPLYAEICPQTFPVLVRTGSRLSQIRFRLEEGLENPKIALSDYPELQRQSCSNNSLMQIRGVPLSVQLAGQKGDDLIGYRAKKHTGVIDMDAANSCDIPDFWEPIFARGHRHLVLDPDEFYILASKESVHVPPEYAAEMVPFNPLVGEFRVHYAGFFDPGFGHGASGGQASKAVLEVRSHKVPFILEDGQIIGHLIYEHLSQPPRELYGRDIGSHYQAQSLKLSKHFKDS